MKEKRLKCDYKEFPRDKKNFGCDITFGYGPKDQPPLNMFRHKGKIYCHKHILSVTNPKDVRNRVSIRL